VASHRRASGVCSTQFALSVTERALFSSSPCPGLSSYCWSLLVGFLVTLRRERLVADTLLFRPVVQPAAVPPPPHLASPASSPFPILAGYLPYAPAVAAAEQRWIEQEERVRMPRGGYTARGRNAFVPDITYWIPNYARLLLVVFQVSHCNARLNY